MKIYALSEGTYSDYSVVAVFTSRQLADEYKQAVNGDWNAVEEYELDPPHAKLIRDGHSLWSVKMLKDGTVEEIEQRVPKAWELQEDPYILPRSTHPAPIWKGKNLPDVLVCRVLAKSNEHAVKITNEFRAQMIAGGKWK